MPQRREQVAGAAGGLAHGFQRPFGMAFGGNGTLYVSTDRDPQGTAAAFRDGWFLTGDIGSLDESGALYLEGRRKTVIFVAGLKFFPYAGILPPPWITWRMS